MCTIVWESFFEFWEYLSRVHQAFLTSRGPPNIIPTFLLSGVWLTFLPNLGVFCLNGWALLVIRLMSTCGLTTTLSIAICYNTTIRPEFVYCALVACGVKYVRVLATTLDITVRCNTCIRLEFVCYVLMTSRYVFVSCSATTLGIAVCATQPLDRSLFALSWQLSVFCPFTAFSLDKSWSWPLDLSLHVEYLQPSI